MEVKQQLVDSVEAMKVFRMIWKESKKARTTLQQCTRNR
jgi:hypothetical protein